MDDQLQMALSPQQPLGGQRVRRITGLWKRKHKKTTGQTYKERLKDNILKFGATNVATLRGKEEEMVELMKLRQLSVLGLSETRMKDAVIELYMEDTGSFTLGKTVEGMG